MKISNNVTFNSDLPSLASETLFAYSNSTPFFEILVNSDSFERSVSWHHHILQQLTFSYLSKDYIARTVAPVMDALPSDSDTQVFIPLRNCIKQLCVTHAINDTSMAALNSAAIAATDFIRQSRCMELASTMNQIGRFIFAKPTPQNAGRVRKLVNYLGLLTSDHISVTKLYFLLHDEFSRTIPNSSDSLKERFRSALERVRDTLQQTEERTCLFFLLRRENACGFARVRPHRISLS